MRMQQNDIFFTSLKKEYASENGTGLNRGSP